MREQIEVIYENGIFRPMAHLNGHYQEQQHLTVTIEDDHIPADWLVDADPTARIEDVRRALTKAPGTLAELIHAERADR